MLGGNAEGWGDYYHKDGTMWRLKNAEISYDIKAQALKSVGINKINVYLNGNNLYVWSHLNEDRETGGKRDHNHIDMYPITRRVQLGLKVSF